LRGAYLRPRFDGFVRFVEFAGSEIIRFLRHDRDTEQVIRLFVPSMSATLRHVKIQAVPSKGASHERSDSRCFKQEQIPICQSGTECALDPAIASTCKP
jgi:hypothetical protein